MPHGFYAAGDAYSLDEKGIYLSMLVVKVLNLFALLGTIAWLSRSPDWEPLVTSLALLSTLIGIEIKQHKANLNSSDNSFSEKKEVDRETYNKQKDMYKSLREVLAKINTKGDVENEQMFELYDLLEESNFLFDDDISLYIREWINKANDLQYSNKRMESTRASKEELEKASEKNLESIRYFSEQYDEIIKRFHPYLQVGDKSFS